MAANIFATGMDAFDGAYDRMQNMREQRARTQAGRKLAAGNRAGAIQDFGEAGLTDNVRQLQSDDLAMQDRASDQERQAKADEQKMVAGRWALLKDTVTGLERVPEGQRAPALKQRLGFFAQLGMPVEQFASLDESQLSNANLAMFGVELDKHKPDWREVKRADGSTYFMDLAAEQPPQRAAPSDAPIPTARPETDSVFEALIAQESGGRAGVTGPQTPYGRAQGMTQMLPATAAAMAKKVGVAWRPDLMQASTPEGAEYQRKLGRAYFEEGLQKYGGDTQKALMYYHGGPNENIWGPKTRGYASAVMQRVGGGQASLAGGQGGDTLQGRRGVVEGSAAPAPEWRDLPGGGQINTRTGKKEGVPGPAADKAPTDGDKKTVGFAYRTLRANDRMNSLMEQGVVKPRTATAQLFESSKNGVVRLATKTNEDRLFFQAAKEWLAPILRKDTGAAVSDQELATYMDIYIPRFEDSPQLLRQKAEARQDAMISLVREGGSLYDRTYGNRAFNTRWGPKPAPGGKASGGGRPPLSSFQR